MRTKYPLKEPNGMDLVTFGVFAQVEVFTGQLWHYLEWVQVANLREQGVNGEFRQGSNFLSVDQVELHIYTPKTNFSQSMEADWTASIKAQYPEIKVVISDVEKHVGI